MRKLPWKSIRPNSLDEAFQLSMDFATKRRRPTKVMSTLMGVELKTMYRWQAETSMPMNRIVQFEEFCGVAYVSEFLSTAAGRIVIDIPTGRKARPIDLAGLHAVFAEAITLLSQHYQNGNAADETAAALTNLLSHAAYHRQNVIKSAAPELALFGGVV